MTILDIDHECSHQIVAWNRNNDIKAEELPFFYQRVLMNVAPDPLPISVKINAQDRYVTFKIKDAEQLSFIEDAERELKRGHEERLDPADRFDYLMKQTSLEAKYELMKGRPEFGKRTKVSFSFKYKGGKIKLTEIPSLEDWYGIDPGEVHIIENMTWKKIFGDNFKPLTLEKFLAQQRKNEEEVFLEQAMKLSELFFSANAFLYYANKAPKQERIIRATSVRNDEGNKVIAFRLLKDSTKEQGEIYAVELPEENFSDPDNVYSVRGHLRRLDNPYYKEAKGRVIWVNAFVKGMPEEYYEEKRKERRKEKREDASLEDPKSWVTDIDEGKER